MTANPRRSSSMKHQCSLNDGKRDEAGAILVLAMVFLVVVGGVVGVLANSVTDHLNTTHDFANNRSLQYTATSAVDLAIQNIRYTPLIATTLEASPPDPCWGVGQTSSVAALNGDGQMDVWCSTVWDPTSTTTRQVTLSACLDNQQGAAGCAANPFLQAIVDFDDYPTGLSAPSTALCDTYCGTGMTISSWLWSPVEPTVTSISTPNGNDSGPISGNTKITVYGTGFVSGATTVNFIQESGLLSTSNQVCSTVSGGAIPSSPTGSACLQVTSPTVVSSTELTVQSPVAINGPNYFVTVTTPTGTSAYNTSQGVFDFTLFPPTVSQLCVAQSSCSSATSAPAVSSAGGNGLTITGSGFFGSPTVQLVEDNSGTASTAVQSAAKFVTVVSSTEMTVVMPAVSAGTTYFVDVTTAGGSSGYSSNDVGVVDYGGPTPIVETATANGTSTVMVTGIGFWTGSATPSVYFLPMDTCSSGGSGPSASSVVVNSPTSITATVPALTPGTSYCVQVQTYPAPAPSSNNVDFTYP
jgi:hypothetical protein